MASIERYESFYDSRDIEYADLAHDISDTYLSWWSSIVGQDGKSVWLPTIQWRLKVNRFAFLLGTCGIFLMLTVICCSLFSVRTLDKVCSWELLGILSLVSCRMDHVWRIMVQTLISFGLNLWKYVHPGDVRDVTISNVEMERTVQDGLERNAVWCRKRKTRYQSDPAVISEP